MAKFEVPPVPNGPVHISDWMSSLTQRVFAVLLCLSSELKLLFLRKADGEDFSHLIGVMCIAEAGEYGLDVLPNCATIFVQQYYDPRFKHAAPDIRLPDYTLIGNFSCLHLWRGQGYISFRHQDISWVKQLRELKLVSCGRCHLLSLNRNTK